MIGVYAMTKAELLSSSPAQWPSKSGNPGSVATRWCWGWVETGMTAGARTGPDGAVDEEQRTQVRWLLQSGSPLGLAGEPVVHRLRDALPRQRRGAVRDRDGRAPQRWRAHGVSVSEPGIPASSERPMEMA